MLSRPSRSVFAISLGLSLAFGAVTACKSKEAAKTAGAATTASRSAAGSPASGTTPAAPPGPFTIGKAPKPPVPLADYFKIQRVRGATFSHDESLVAYESDQGGRMDLWVQPVGGGTPRQLTKTTGYIHSFAFSPTEDRLAYEADLGGEELPHLYLTSSKGEPGVDLTADDPKHARTQFLRWSEDGTKILYLSSRRDAKFLDLYELTVATGKSELLWKASEKRSLELASRDHQRFILNETRSDADFNLYLLERGGKEELLTPHRGEVMFGAAAFSHDGTKLYFTSDEDREFSALHAMDLKTKRSEPVLRGQWDVDSALVSRTGRYLVTVTNADGEPEVTFENASTHIPLRLPAPPEGGVLVPLTFSKNDRYLAAKLVSDTAPQTLYVIDVQALAASARKPPAPAAKVATKLVDPVPESLRGRKMVAGKLVRIPSFDGRFVPAFLYAPLGKGPFPAIIDVHGGPTAQSKRAFHQYRQYFVSKGYALLVPNVRGSTGYGKTYMRLDNLDLGGGPLKDIVACKKWLATSANVDERRVVVLGASYGGYMALAAAAFTPGEFAAHVDWFGVSDLKTLVESFPPYWASYATFIHKKFGDPKNAAHAKYQRERSPLHSIDKITRPLLVVQGTNDARVKKDQSDRVVEKLRERKVPVHYLVLEGEGHGFSKTENFQKALDLTDVFLDRYVWEDSSVVVPN